MFAVSVDMTVDVCYAVHIVCFCRRIVRIQSFRPVRTVHIVC